MPRSIRRGDARSMVVMALLILVSGFVSAGVFAVICVLLPLIYVTYKVWTFDQQTGMEAAKMPVLQFHTLPPIQEGFIVYNPCGKKLVAYKMDETMKRNELMRRSFVHVARVSARQAGSLEPHVPNALLHLENGSQEAAGTLKEEKDQPDMLSFLDS